LLAFLILNLQPSTAHAQGTAFMYQGQLASGGLPASGTYNLAFALFNNTNVGAMAIAGPVADNGVLVTNGLFTVTIDFGESVWNGQTNWLQIGVETNGGTSFTALTNLEELTPTPYAIYAERAGGVNNASISAPQLNTVGLPSAGQVLEYSGGNLVLATPSGGSGGWSLTGNADTIPRTDFLGTSDKEPLELHVDGVRGWQLAPTADTPNVIGGAPGNFVAAGVQGATIDGGGTIATYGRPYTNSIFSYHGTIGGGLGNTIQANAIESTIGGGNQNTIPNGANDSAVGGGYLNISSSPFATVGGGYDNNASGTGSFVGGGGIDGYPNDEYFGNTASGAASTVAGGFLNLASGDYATVPGGAGNTASGNYATVPGGDGNTALGSCSFAAGEFTYANDNNSFIWGDGTRDGVSQGIDTFTVLATGGVFFLTTTNGNVVEVDNTGDLDFGSITRQMINLYGTNYGIGVQDDDEYFRTAGEFWWYNGGTNNNAFGNSGGGTALMRLGSTGSLIIAGTFTANGGVLLTSDRNLKENFKPVDSQAVLAKVASLPVTEWNYKAESKASQHIGPMAQDFQAAFGLDGADDKHISVVDEGGVALAAIQGLNQKLEETQQAVKAKDDEIRDLKQRLDALEKIVLKQKSN
jgi:hypothetical protein